MANNKNENRPKFVKLLVSRGTGVGANVWFNTNRIISAAEVPNGHEAKKDHPSAKLLMDLDMGPKMGTVPLVETESSFVAAVSSD